VNPVFLSILAPLPFAAKNLHFKYFFVSFSKKQPLSYEFSSTYGINPKITMRILNDFVNLFYPSLCISCTNTLLKNEAFLCTRCLYFLPRTNFQYELDNPVARIFWGRVRVDYATAYFYFNKGSRYQKILHQLKYKGKKEIGQAMGNLFGLELKNSPFNQADLIIPVPLHRSKQRKRGYNQAEWIAMGLSEAMNIRLDAQSVIRVTASSTQTRKSRYDRFTNVQGIFAVKSPQNLENRHILLVDDVVTTGATLEALATQVLQVPNTRVSIAALAMA
jgi:ComF family protein